MLPSFTAPSASTGGGIALTDVATALPQVAQYTATPTALMSDLALASPFASTSMTAFARPVGVAGSQITVRKNHLHQEILGVGVALTDISAKCIMTYMSAAQRTAYLTDLFVTRGIKFVRVPMGSSDCNGYGTSNQGPGLYTYADNGGVADPTLASFSIANDLAYVVPCLLAIQAVAPDIKFMFEPWSPPAWLKSTNTIIGPTSFVENTANFATMAQYFVKHYQAVSAYGINVWGYGLQNEPQASVTYASCQYTAAGIANLSAAVRSAFDAAGIGSFICAPSVNAINISSYYGAPGTASTLLNSAVTSASVDGLVAHSYDTYGIQAQIENPYPIQFEQARRPYPRLFWIHNEYCFNLNNTSTGRAYSRAVSVAEEIIPFFRAGAGGFMWWNLAFPTSGSYLNGGLRPVTYIDPATGNVTYPGEYYDLCHLGMAIKPGARRCACSSLAIGSLGYDVQALAFVNPDQSVGVYAFNNAAASKTVSFLDAVAGQLSTLVMPAGALATVTWGSASVKSPAAGTITAPSAPTLSAPTAAGLNVSVALTPGALGTTALGAVLPKRGTSSGLETAALPMLPGAATSFTDIGTPGQSLFYTATVRGGGGESAVSNEVTITLPNPPTWTAVSPTAGDGSVSFALNVQANGAPVTSINVLRATVAGGESPTPIGTATLQASPPASGATTATYVDATVIDGTTYYYEFVATCSVGTVTSGEVHATPVAAAGSLNTLTASNVVPVPGQVFTSTISGGTSGSTFSAVSSDATPLTISGTTITSTSAWALTATGTRPTLSITETPSGGGSPKTTNVALNVAEIWTPAKLSPASRVRFDMSATVNGSNQLTAISSTGTKGGGYTTTGSPVVAAVAAAKNQLGIAFNGTSMQLLGNVAERGVTSGAPGMSYYSVFVAPPSITTSTAILFNGINSSNLTRSAFSIASDKLVTINRSTDGQSSAQGTSETTALTPGSLYIGIGEINLPAGTSKIRVNGAVDQTGTVTTATAYPSNTAFQTNIGGGGTDSSPVGYFAGTILEVGAIQGVVTANSEYLIEGYANAWFGAPLTGPAGTASGHPFATFPPCALNLSSITANHGQAYSAQISGLPPGATGVTINSSDGTTFTQPSAGFVSGTFSAAGTATITLSATYNGVTLSGTTTVTIS